MITINLQYLAFIPYSFMIYHLIMGGYRYFSLRDGTDIAPVIGLGLAFYHIVSAFLLSVLGWLIMKAFRP